MRPVTDLQRRVAPFKVVSDYEPSGDQPAAIKEIVGRIQGGEKDVPFDDERALDALCTIWVKAVYWRAEPR